MTISEMIKNLEAVMAANGDIECYYAEDDEDAPTVDAVEVVHGRWEKHEPDKHGYGKPKCSVCGQYHLAWWSDYTHCNYCPQCGAKMDLK